MKIELQNGTINAEVRGTGMPILIMHGGGLDHRHMMDALEPVFAHPSGWQRVYIDLPGHGKSAVNENINSQDDVFNLINDFVDSVFNNEKFAVIGESRGSYHAMALVHNRPDDLLGMMLVVADGMPDNTVNWRPKHQTLVSELDEVVEKASGEAKARFARLVVQTPEILDKIERTKIAASGLVDEAHADRISQRFNFSFDLTRPLGLFEKPSLILNGRQDAMAGYKDMLDGIERYPRATLAVLDMSGHSLSWEQPELFKSLTLDWLARMEHHISALE